MPDTIDRFVLEDQNRLGESLRFLGTQQSGYVDRVDLTRLASAKVFISVAMAKRRQRQENNNSCLGVRFEIRQLICALVQASRWDRLRHQKEGTANNSHPEPLYELGDYQLTTQRQEALATQNHAAYLTLLAEQERRDHERRDSYLYAKLMAAPRSVLVSPSCGGKTTWLRRLGLPEWDMDRYLNETLTGPEEEQVLKVPKGQWSSVVGKTMTSAMSRCASWRLGTVLPTWARSIIFIRPSDETLVKRALNRRVSTHDVLNMANWLDGLVASAQTAGMDVLVWKKH